jgi:hypothetical protein
MSAKIRDRVELEPYGYEHRHIDVMRVPEADKVALWFNDGWLSATTQFKPAEARELASLLLGVVAEIEGDGDGPSFGKPRRGN